jgi:hypothetical protein
MYLIIVSLGAVAPGKGSEAYQTQYLQATTSEIRTDFGTYLVMFLTFVPVVSDAVCQINARPHRVISRHLIVNARSIS